LELRSGSTYWDFSISNQYDSNPSLVIGAYDGTFVTFLQGGTMYIPSDLGVTGSTTVGGNMSVQGPVNVNGILSIGQSNTGSNASNATTWNMYIDSSNYSNPELVFENQTGQLVRFDNSNMYINGNIIFESQTNIPLWLLTDNVLNKCPCTGVYEHQIEGPVLINGDLTVNGNLCATSIVNTIVTQSLELRSGTTMWDFSISNQFTSNPQLVIGSPGGTYVSFFQGGNFNVPSDLNVEGVSTVGGSLAINGIVTVNGNLAIGNAVNPTTRSTWSNYVDDANNLVFESSKGTVVEFSELFSAEQLNFTGKHRCVDSRNSGNSRISNRHVGKIVCASGSYVDLDGNTTILIDEALPVVKLCTQYRDGRAFGVVGGLENEGRFRVGNLVFLKNGQLPRVIVQSQGEGAMWVTNAAGNFTNGDLVTTCWIPGYGVRQGSNRKYNYTVAKITCDCNFSFKSPVYECRSFTFHGKRYKKALVGCVYCF
jgi:hypothetical protein